MDVRIACLLFVPDWLTHRPIHLRLRALCHGAPGVCMVQTVTPLSPLRQRVRHRMHAPRGVPRFISAVVHATFAEQFERDLPIWERKRMLARPGLARGDGPVPRFRAWYRSRFERGAEPFEAVAARHAVAHALQW